MIARKSRLKGIILTLKEVRDNLNSYILDGRDNNQPIEELADEIYIIDSVMEDLQYEVDR